MHLYLEDNMYQEIETLLKLSRQGNVQAKEDLLKKLFPLIISSIRTYYNKKDRYDDLVQMGYEEILKTLDEFDESRQVKYLAFVKSRLKFLYLQLHRQGYTYYLDQEVSDGQNLIDFIEDGENPLDSVIDKETTREVYQALGYLPPRQRQIIIEYYINNLSMIEISKKLGLAYRTVVNTKEAGLKNLRKRLVR